LAAVSNISPALKKRAVQIRVLLMDVDGTMTDGSVTLLSQADGSALEIKTFDAHDGQGLTLAQTAGLRTGCITGRESAALLRRAHEMKMEFIYEVSSRHFSALDSREHGSGGASPFYNGVRRREQR
jgi:3-deoxy-D-manno-octulosonate 8-phosphate phosphatase (KDO 8-P phosphatase)